MKIMKRILPAIVVTALLSISALAQPQSLWMLQSRLSGKYIFDAPDAPGLSATPSGDAFLWKVEAADGAAVRIINISTGRPLGLLDADLNIEGFQYADKANAGWYTISSGNGVLAECGERIVFTDVDRRMDYGAHWSFVRQNSSLIPFVIGNDSVKESSFLGERTSRAVSETEIVSDYHGEKRWKLSEDISSFPQFRAPGNTMVTALYNMALEESLKDVRQEDDTFMAGALWPQTWTRDVVYSIFFTYSWIMPEISRRTLEKQTLKNPSEALQDTGSGGSYPISTDRVVWALAAWEYFLSTGDKDWLKQTYEGLSYTAKKDIHVAYDSNIHLFRGETCSMDWRIHTYPNWFTNANIGESFSSGTNALHYFLYRFLLAAGKEIGADEEDMNLWKRISAELRQGMDDAFWDEEKSCYACYLYPEFTGYKASTRVGVMSNGLAALLGVASEDKVHDILANYPVYAYGGSVLYPTKPDSYAYHNKSVWPVWQTPLMYAAKKNGNTALATHLAQTAVRAGAMFLTHKENMTYDTGFDCNTALNSDRQLWSVASYLSIIYRLFIGMELTPEGMSFKPMMPSWLGGEANLKSMKYRNAIVDVKVTGTGDKVVSMKVNGVRKKAGWILPTGARGHYNVEICVKESESESSFNLVPAGPGNCWSPEEPVIRLENGQIFWTDVPGCTYRLYGRDTVVNNVHSPYNVTSLPQGYYNLCAVDFRGIESDLSNPVLKTSWSMQYPVNVRDFRENHEDFSVNFKVPADGDYLIWFTGCNGRGPHDVYCAIRSIFLDGKDIATLLLEAYGDWDEVTLSNHILLKGLSLGDHVITVRLNPENRGFDNNMSFNRENWNDWFAGTFNVVSM